MKSGASAPFVFYENRYQRALDEPKNKVDLYVK
jgi:hypothetical protein